MKHEGIMLSEISQTEKDKYLYVEYFKRQTSKTENKMVFTRGRRWEWEEGRDVVGGHRLATSRYYK